MRPRASVVRAAPAPGARGRAAPRAGQGQPAQGPSAPNSAAAPAPPGLPAIRAWRSPLAAPHLCCANPTARVRPHVTSRFILAASTKVQVGLWDCSCIALRHCKMKPILIQCSVNDAGTKCDYDKQKKQPPVCSHVVMDVLT